MLRSARTLCSPTSSSKMYGRVMQSVLVGYKMHWTVILMGMSYIRSYFFQRASVDCSVWKILGRELEALSGVFIILIHRISLSSSNFHIVKNLNSLIRGYACFTLGSTHRSLPTRRFNARSISSPPARSRASPPNSTSDYTIVKGSDASFRSKSG